ncbi:hypothetical protein DL771_005550 [Monosporascus sp. 5C6A]|nr:hypothetical protein DL771_005550 [Monosporascus sp. 5C6A]
MGASIVSLGQDQMMAEPVTTFRSPNAGIEIPLAAWPNVAAARGLTVDSAKTRWGRIKRKLGLNATAKPLPEPANRVRKVAAGKGKAAAAESGLVAKQAAMGAAEDLGNLQDDTDRSEDGAGETNIVSHRKDHPWSPVLMLFHAVRKDAPQGGPATLGEKYRTIDPENPLNLRKRKKMIPLLVSVTTPRMTTTPTNLKRRAIFCQESETHIVLDTSRRSPDLSEPLMVTTLAVNAEVELASVEPENVYFHADSKCFSILRAID